MDKNYLYKKAGEFDSDNNKTEELATFLRMYISEFAQKKLPVIALKQSIEGLSDYFIKIELMRRENEIQIIKDFVLIEKFYWSIDLIHEKVPGIDIAQLDSYVKILDCMESNQLLERIVRYTKYERYRISSEMDLMKYEHFSVPKYKKTEVEEVKTIEDIVMVTMAKLSCAYWNIIETPERKEDIKRTTFEYADLVNDLLHERYKGSDLNEYLVGVDSAVQNRKYAEISAVIYSPESIFVIMNNYRMAKEDDKDTARTLLLKISYLQSEFIFGKKSRSNLSDTIDEDDYCEGICQTLDNYIDSLGSERTVIPAIPFYNLSYFASRVGKDDRDEARLIVGIDHINDVALYGKSDAGFDLFVDEVLASVAENRLNEGKSINSEYDTDVYAAVQQILGWSYPDGVAQFMNEYRNNEDSRYEEISCTVKYYLLGIYLRTLYMLADSIEGHDGAYPFRVYRDRIQSLIFNNRSYGKASSIFSRYSFENMNMVEEKAYSNLKNEMLMTLDAALENIESYDEVINLDFKSSFTEYFLWLGSDDYFLNMVETVYQKIRKSIELFVRPEPRYRDLFNDLIKQYDDQMKKVEIKVNTYMRDDSLQVLEKVKKSISGIATGEFLYQRYIVRDDIPQMDYSCIALEYYTALELLVNTIFYAPYRQMVLKPKCDSISGDNLDDELRGYIGSSKAAYITGRGKEPKESLELGTISNLYINLLRKNGSVDPKAAELAYYLDALGLDKVLVREIFKEINKIKDLRNEAAHGGEILPYEKAKKAQDVVYIHSPNPDPTIDIDAKSLAAACHNMVGKIYNLF